VRIPKLLAIAPWPDRAYTAILTSSSMQYRADEKIRFFSSLLGENRRALTCGQVPARRESQPRILAIHYGVRPKGPTDIVLV
jgi:hypothetical protein